MGDLWVSMSLYGDLGPSEVSLWVSMSLCGDLWVPMGPYVSLWGLYGICVSLWVSMGSVCPCVSLWVSMGSVSLCVPWRPSTQQGVEADARCGPPHPRPFSDGWGGSAPPGSHE